MAEGTAIVTGGRRGIGRGICEAMARRGFDVAIVDLERDADAERTLDLVDGLGRRAVFVQGDVADLAGHDRLLDAAEALGGPLVCLVNNAGVSSLVRGDLLDLSPESFDRCIAVNLRGAFFLSQRFARRLVAAAPAGMPGVFRTLINITSANVEILGLNRVDYCVSKAALSTATRHFAARLAEARIHVYEVRPGMIRTEMTAPSAARYDSFLAAGGVPIARWGEPEDVGQAVAALADGAFGFSTGDAVRVDGGLHMYRV